MNHTKPCHHLLNQLSDYLDGTATTEICAEIEKHLADCSDCRVVVDTLQQTVHLYHTLPQPDLPQQARERLYKTLNLEPFLKTSSG